MHGAHTAHWLHRMRVCAHAAHPASSHVPMMSCAYGARGGINNAAHPLPMCACCMADRAATPGLLPPCRSKGGDDDE